MKLDDISAHARQYERHHTEYEARIEPHPDHAEQFRLSFPDTQMKLAVVDVSGGGLGLVSGFYIPKNLRVTLHVSGIPGEKGESNRDLTIRGIVRRCGMSDHKPTYQVGLQFADTHGHDERILIKYATVLREQNAEPVSIGGAGAT